VVPVRLRSRYTTTKTISPISPAARRLNRTLKPALRIRLSQFGSRAFERAAWFGRLEEMIRYPSAYPTAVSRDLRFVVTSTKTLNLMVPDEGIEPPTFGLQNRCSTAELIRRPWAALRYQRADLRARARRQAAPAATVGAQGPCAGAASSMPGQGGMVIATNARAEAPSARN
jgi:hypothetical protein